jgi:hypothetical protein
VGVRGVRCGEPDLPLEQRSAGFDRAVTDRPGQPDPERREHRLPAGTYGTVKFSSAFTFSTRVALGGNADEDLQPPTWAALFEAARLPATC